MKLCLFCREIELFIAKIPATSPNIVNSRQTRDTRSWYRWWYHPAMRGIHGKLQLPVVAYQSILPNKAKLVLKKSSLFSVSLTWQTCTTLIHHKDGWISLQRTPFITHGETSTTCLACHQRLSQYVHYHCNVTNHAAFCQYIWSASKQDFKKPVHLLHTLHFL